MLVDTPEQIGDKSDGRHPHADLRPLPILLGLSAIGFAALQFLSRLDRKPVVVGPEEATLSPLADNSVPIAIAQVLFGFLDGCGWTPDAHVAGARLEPLLELVVACCRIAEDLGPVLLGDRGTKASRSELVLDQEMAVETALLRDVVGTCVHPIRVVCCSPCVQRRIRPVACPLPRGQEHCGGERMIFHPRIEQRVRVHYAKAGAAAMPYHGKAGIVRVVSKGPGPRNVGVKIDGRLVVVPRGNLVAVKEDRA